MLRTHGPALEDAKFTRGKFKTNEKPTLMPDKMFYNRLLRIEEELGNSAKMIRV